MNQGIICISRLYQFARAHREDDALRVDRSNELSNQYIAICHELVSGVLTQAGLYLWGFYNKTGFWVNVYIGKTGFKKTAHLRARLFKELTAERACIWREVYPNKDELFDAAKRVHNPRMWPKYTKSWRRALRKAGATHIIWVATPHLSADNLESVENDLIEAMNPTGNRKRLTPPQTYQRETTEVLGKLRQLIHRDHNRASRFHLRYHDEFWKWLGEAEPNP